VRARARSSRRRAGLDRARKSRRLAHLFAERVKTPPMERRPFLADEFLFFLFRRVVSSNRDSFVVHIDREMSTMHLSLRASVHVRSCRYERNH